MLGSTRTHFSRTAVCTAAFGVLLICVAVFFIWVDTVSAQIAFEQLGTATKLPKTELITIIARVIRAFLSVLGIIFVLLMIYAGYLYMTSQGEQAKTQKAIAVIKQAVIGFVIIMASYAITTFVINALLKATGGQITTRPPIEKYTEPLGGSLGAGIIESHYPPRNAIDIPRNTKIFVTFKEPMELSSIIHGEGQLNTSNVWIFETNKGKDRKLAADAVNVTAIEGGMIFVFDPIDLLGNPQTDTNYTVALQSGIKKAGGKNAFSGAYGSGYGWTFEVSTVVDLTAPRVLGVYPIINTLSPRNATIEMTFNEAMDPVSSTGSFLVGQAQQFTNISVLGQDGVNVDGTFKISNGYRTIGFTTTDACAEDPCGNTIYCLPASEPLSVEARAATIDTANIPQAVLSGSGYDGLTDAAGNSLDGSGNGIACGSDVNNQSEDRKRQMGAKASGELNCPAGVHSDDYVWAFSTSGEIDDTVPRVVSLSPGVGAQEIDPNAPVELTFNTLLSGSAVNSQNVKLWPDPLYSMWFMPQKTDNLVAGKTTVRVQHPAFISNAEGGYIYYPVVTHGLKGINQFCMYPAMIDQATIDPSLQGQASECNGDTDNPNCCYGLKAPCNTSAACRTQENDGDLPDNLP